MERTAGLVAVVVAGCMSVPAGVGGEDDGCGDMGEGIVGDDDSESPPPARASAQGSYLLTDVECDRYDCWDVILEETAFSGEDGGPNSAEGGPWPDIHVACSIEDGVEHDGLQAFVSDAPIHAPSDGRNGVELVNARLTGGSTETYWIRVWRGGVGYDFDSQNDVDQLGCNAFSVERLASDSFRLSFDCWELLEDGGDGWVNPSASITFAGCAQ